MTKLDFIYKIEPRAKDFEIITLKALQGMLQSSKGTKIVTLVTITDPDLKKETGPEHSPNPYLPCVKVSRVNGIVNWSYENSVNLQLLREGKEPNFEAQPRKWGTHLNDSPFVSHVNKAGEHNLYLEVRVKSSLGHSYYSIDGEEILEEKIEPYLKKKQSVKEFQGVEREVILRDYNVKNIVTLVIDKTGLLIKENL